MRNRFATRMSRSFDRRKDEMARRVAAWSPLAGDAASLKHPTAGVTIRVSGASPLHVLVVDNDTRAADSLELLLHSGGYPTTRVAYTAHAALVIAVEFSPSIALLDLDMRDMNAYELAHTLWERARLRRVRLIGVTRSHLHADRGGTGRGEFERFLLKPITAADLSSCMTSEQFASSHSLTPSD